MKKIIFFNSFLLTLCFFLITCSNNTTNNQEKIKKNTPIDLNTTAGIFNVDTVNSNIEWVGEKTTGKHNGNIKIQKGVITIDKNGNIANGKFMLDMTSINCTDLQGKRKTSLEEHLKDPDFFDTHKHPVASFIINKANSKTIYGTLTIKGISQEISFNYQKTNALNYTAEIIVDRTLFDIKYKSKTIFKDIGDHFIYDNFIITLNPLILK